MSRRLRGGVYVWRSKKPSAFLGWPFIGRHFAYVGETTSFFHREAQHRENQPWSDLDPVIVLRIPLPPWKWLLRSVETVVILLLWPVYNHSKNLWNPRRIPLHVAKRQRRARDRRGWSLNVRPAHIVMALALIALGVWIYVR